MADPLPRGVHGLDPAYVQEHQRQRILQAVANAMPTSGFTHLSVAMIVKEARVSRRTFYACYPDREAALVDAIAAAHQGKIEIPDRLAGDSPLVRADRATLGAIPGWLLTPAINGVFDG